MQFSVSTPPLLDPIDFMSPSSGSQSPCTMGSLWNILHRTIGKRLRCNARCIKRNTTPSKVPHGLLMWVYSISSFLPTFDDRLSKDNPTAFCSAALGYRHPSPSGISPRVPATHHCPRQDLLPGSVFTTGSPPELDVLDCQG